MLVKLEFGGVLAPKFARRTKGNNKENYLSFKTGPNSLKISIVIIQMYFVFFYTSLMEQGQRSAQPIGEINQALFLDLPKVLCMLAKSLIMILSNSSNLLMFYTWALHKRNWEYFSWVLITHLDAGEMPLLEVLAVFSSTFPAQVSRKRECRCQKRAEVGADIISYPVNREFETSGQAISCTRGQGTQSNVWAPGMLHRDAQTKDKETTTLGVLTKLLLNIWTDTDWI